MFHQFPIEAIKMHNGKFLMDETEVIRVTNLGNVIELKNKEGSLLDEVPSALLVGDPQFYLQQGNDITQNTFTRPLPETSIEVDGIDQFLKASGWRVTKLKGKMAQESIIKKTFSPAVIHIATHGTHEQDTLKSPFDSFHKSYVKLAGYDDKRNSADRNNDGKLDGQEVTEMNLSETDLAVLSACETGIGSTINAEGIMGIARAFQIAGVKSVIGTLWKVDSEETIKFMQYFYEALVESKNKFTAFDSAKLRMKEEYESPYFWAGYIMIN